MVRKAAADFAEPAALTTAPPPQTRLSFELLYWILIHMIHDNHRNGPLLFHQFESQLFFDCLEHRDTGGVRRLDDRSGRLIRIRSLGCLQHPFGCPANPEIPPTLKRRGVNNWMIDIGVGHLL